MAIAIGIDIGGTKTAIGLVDGEGKVFARTSLPTDLAVPPAEMVGRMAGAVRALMESEGLGEPDIAGIGVGAPGPLSPADGILTCPPNLRAWWGFNVVEAIGRELPYPIRMENDATAATLAEKWVGAAAGAEHFVFVTISTGIGAGIYLHGKLLTGATGNAGDAGHIVVDPAAGKCPCGQIGCWEWVASGTAIARQAAALLGREVHAKEAFDLAAEGDAQMRALIDRVYHYVGVGCVSLINLFDPEMIVIGGGVSQAGPELFDSVQQYVSKHALNPSGRGCRIVPAALLQDAGLIGAAALVHMPYR